jgi:hypothetical protein
MTAKRVLLFSRDPGGCNSVAPLVSFLEAHAFKVFLYAKDFSCDRMKTIFGLTPKDISEELKIVNEDTLGSWLSSLKPDAVITGTSFGDATERDLWSACERLKIPSMALLDHWINYRIRFEKPNGSTVFPQYLIVPDESAKTLALEEKIPAHCLHAWGNPYYQYLTASLKLKDPTVIRSKFHCTLSSNRLVVFASEAFSMAPTNFGYDERTVLTSLIESLQKCAPLDQQVSLVVRPHPKEDLKEISEYCQRFSDTKLQIYVSTEETSVDLINASDLVCGMISQFLIEGSVMKKPVLSIQIGLNAKDPFILTQKNILPLITQKSQLDDGLQRFFLGTLETPKLKFPNQCMERILTELENIL